MIQPYVVSADIYLLIKEWASRNGFIPPDRGFVTRLREDFSTFMRRMFPQFDLVSEEELADGISNFVTKSGLAFISLDRVYLHSPSAIHLDITRLVDHAGEDRGLAHRPNTLPLFQQFKKLKKAGLKEVVLVDDVIFTGVLIEKVICLLSKMGISVPLVCTGIGIAEGVRRISKANRKIHCVRMYGEVIDEICERDFYPGVPFSGRQLIGNENVGVPYLLPFGNPEKWASIPIEWQMLFSQFCIRQTTALFEEVERRSNKIVRCVDTGRYVFGLPQDKTRFVDALKNL